MIHSQLSIVATTARSKGRIKTMAAKKGKKKGGKKKK